MSQPRHDWTIPEIESIYSSPLLDLLLQAQTVHRERHQPNVVQGCVLLNVKSGGCPEDCAYCPQSAHYKTGTDRYDPTRPSAPRARPVNRAPPASAWAPRGATPRKAKSSTAC
jgi:biotin synthase